MRYRRAIRTLFVFVLLGAVATVLTSWAIHAAQFYHARSAQNPPFEMIPRVWWPVDLELAERHGIDTTIRSGELGIDTDERYLSTLRSSYHRMGRPWNARAGINADAAWRRYRRENDRLSRTPDYPFPYLMFDSNWSRAAWPVLVSEVHVMNDAVEPERVSITELLWVVRPGWPFAAMEVGAHYAELIEFRPRHQMMNGWYSGFPRVEELAAPSAVGMSSGIELWAAPRPQIATGNAHPIRYAPTDRFALPLLPLWPGFAINTAFYALLLFLAWRASRVVRRTHRRRRGQCAACGYDRGGLDAGTACPECGAGVPGAVADGAPRAAHGGR